MKMLRITLEGKTYDVGVEVLDDTFAPFPHPAHSLAVPVSPVPSPPVAVPLPAPAPATPAPAAKPAAEVTAAAGCRAVTSPMVGVVFKCLTKPGDVVALNQVLLVLDAMKMETPIHAPVAGTVVSVSVKEGDAVDDGSILAQIEEHP